MRGQSGQSGEMFQRGCRAVWRAEPSREDQHSWLRPGRESPGRPEPDEAENSGSGGAHQNPPRTGLNPFWATAKAGWAGRDIPLCDPRRSLLSLTFDNKRIKSESQPPSPPFLLDLRHVSSDPHGTHIYGDSPTIIRLLSCAPAVVPRVLRFLELAGQFEEVYLLRPVRKGARTGKKEHRFSRFDQQRSRWQGGGTTLKEIL